MTSVEKRRSGRKSGRHRKHSDGGYSDTSSGGSFLDETDREVSSLTDRAFRSLCIGDEAVYNDSDLCSSSPCSQRDRQLAFSQRGQDRHKEDREREELKRAAHESFTVRVQQYGQDWMHGGMYGAEIQRDPLWEAYGERTQGRVSATFQRSFVETSQQEKSLREDQLSFFSNGATDLSSQQRRSRSRVSSLIRAFNSDGHRDGAGMDGKIREWNNETSWDNSALMNIQRELSEFSSSYQQNFNSDHFLTAGPFTSQNTGFYSSEVAAVAHTNAASAYMSASHSKHMSMQVNCNSNFFIHSEFSPFKVWRDHNRFPFQGDVSGFMHCSEFPKWYETPMYRELSQEARPQGPYRFEEGGIGNLRNNIVPMVPPTPQRSTSTSTMLQKASAVEKRCESELAGHYPHRKRMQSLGTNKLPSQRPSTASPTIEMSRRVRDTISSVKALQQKIKMMAEQNMEMDMKANQQAALCGNDNLISFGNSAVTVAANAVRGNTTPLNISQLLTPSVHANQEAGTSVVQQGAVSPQLVEHPPVRAESRGATPDIRMSSYRSRATSLLFNLKDNRKRVKNTYSPTKFKQPSMQEPRDTVIDIPDYPEPDIQFTQVEQFSRTSAASHQYANQYQNPGLSLPTQNSHPKTAHAGQYSEHTLGDYQTAQRQSEMVHHSMFSGFTPENYTTNQLANGQYLHEDLRSFTSYKQSMKENAESLVGEEYRIQPSYTATEAPRNTVNNQTREYFISRANAEQHFNETVGRESTKVDRYQQLKDNKHDYGNVSTKDRWRETNSQDTERLDLRAAVSPWKQEITALRGKEQHAQAYQRAAQIKEELHLPTDKYRGVNQQIVNAELETRELRHSYGAGLVNPNISNQLPQYAPEISNDTLENQAYYRQQQPGTIREKYALQKHHGHNEENVMKNCLTQNYDRYTDPENPNQHIFNTSKDKTMCMQETGQRKPYMPVPKGHKMQSLQPVQATPPIEHNVHKNALSNPDNDAESTIALNQVKDRQLAEVRDGQATAEIAKTELAKVQHWAQVEPPKAESARLILAGQTGSEKVKAQQAKAEQTEHQRIKPATIEEKKKGEQTEKSREKHPVYVREQTKAREQKITEEPKNLKEEAGAMHMKEEQGEQGEQVKAEQAGVERMKEEHIKTELARTEQFRIQQTAQVRREEEERLRAEQIERERRETERTRAEKIKAGQAKQEQQAKSEQEKMLRMEKVKTDDIKVKDVKLEKMKVDSIKVCVNAEQTISELNKAKEPKAEKQTKVELTKAELTKTKDLQERLVKPGAKLAAKQQVKCEPDKVEQVKTELAKAKAELAKIKEKMKGEQKVRTTNIVMENDIAKKDIHLNTNMNINEDYKNQDGATQMHQLNEDSLVSKFVRDQVDRGADNFNSLRGKYGTTNTCSTNRKEELTARTDSSNDDKETPIISPTKAETVNNNKSNDKNSPASGLAKANTENKEESRSIKSNEETEGHYVYSESSKEFKLSSSDNLPTHVDNGANCDIISNKVKDDSFEKLGKCEDARLTNELHQRDSDLTKLGPLERKPKSVEHSAGPRKDMHFTPPRALTHKERAQTKQEILTSKIKAHAEKEISAIKEKGFAIRDGFISKNSTKQLAGSLSLNIRQRPPSQDVPKKHESTMSSNITPKHQMEQSGVQTETVKSVPTPSSAIIPVKSAATTGHSVEHSQKRVTKEPMKSTDNVRESTKDATQTGCDPKITARVLVDKQKNESQSGVKSLMQSKEQAPVDKSEKQKTNHGANPGKQKDGVKDNPVISTDQQKKEKEDLSKATPLVKAESSKPMTSEQPESKYEELHEDSAPSINLFSQDQNKTPVTHDSLQITGIMVIVREREQSKSDNTNKEQINTKEKEHSNSELDKCHPSSGLEVSTGKDSPTENSKTKEKDRVAQELCPTEKEDNTKVGVRNEIVQENLSENVPVKGTELQKSTSIDAKPQREMQFQEPLAEKVVPSTVTAPSKNKVLPETQPLLHKQDIKDKEKNDYSNKMPKQKLTKDMRKDELKNNLEETNDQKTPTAHTNDNFKAKEENIGIKSDSKKADAEVLVNPDVQLSSTEDVTTVIDPYKIRSIDGESAPRLVEKRNDSTPLNPLNKTTPSQHLPEKQNNHVSQRLETHTQVDDDVHIDSIAIRVVPSCAVTKNDNLNTAGKNNATVVPADVVGATEHKEFTSSSSEEKVNSLTNKDKIKDLTQEVASSSSEEKVNSLTNKDKIKDLTQEVASSSSEEKVNSLTNKDKIKDLTPEVASSSSEEKVNSLTNKDKIKDLTAEDKFGVQYVLSSVKKLSDSLKISKQKDSIKVATENTQAEHQMSDEVKNSRNSVDKSKAQGMEGDYFQVQGVADTNNDLHNSANDGAMLDGVSNERIPPASLNRTSVNEEVKNYAFALNQSKRKTIESSTVGVQNANVEEKNRETETLKQSNVPTERQEVGQANNFRKSSLSARERQSSRHSYLTRDNCVKEKTEVQPKPKERISAIPEISALADYARLKVIVSEEQENTIQEFPPNKKEGFFPLIQSRHSRRPVFTDDPKDISVKEKHLPNKTEMSAKINKEPKALVFPITEKEHQRTGMFKLGDKDKQEKMVLDAPSVSDVGAKHAHSVKEENKSLTTHLKNQTGVEQVSGSDTLRLSQIEQRVPQPVNPALKTTTSCSAVNKPRNITASQHLKSPVNSYPHEKYEEFSSKLERTSVSDENSQPTSGEIHNLEDSTTPRKEEKLDNRVVKTGEERTSQEATQHEETTPTQSKEERVSRIEEEKRTEEMRIKHIMEESRASLAEEEKRAIQREEERRAKEREAIASRIKERREKQREADKKAEKERKEKQVKDDRAAITEEEIRAKLRREGKEKEIERLKSEDGRRAKFRGEADWLKDNEERMRLKQEEKGRASREEPQKRASEEEQQQKAAQEEPQRRATEEKRQRKTGQEEQQRKAAQEEPQRRATEEERQRKTGQEEQQRRAALIEEQQRRAAQEEQQSRAALIEEQQRRAAEEEQQRKAAQEEPQRRATEEKWQRKTGQEEQQRRAALIEEQQSRAAQEEQQSRAALIEEQQRRAPAEKQQSRAALIEEQQGRAAPEEQQSKGALEEQQRKAAQEEKQRKAAQEEKQRKAAQEEKQRKAAQEEQQRRAAHEEQQRKAAQEEQQKKAAQEELQRKAAQEEQQRRAALIEEQQKRAAQEEHQRRAAQEEQQRRAAKEEQQRRAAQEEQQRRATEEERQRKAAQEEQRRRASLIEEKQKRPAKEEQKRSAAQEEQQSRAAIEEQPIIAALIEEKQRKAAQEELQKITKQMEEKRLAEIEQENIRTQREEENKKATDKEKIIMKEERARQLEESQAEKGRREAQEQIAQREDEIMAKKREEEEKLVSQREKERASQMEEHKRAAQMMDALQYYAISSTESERKPKDRQLRSPLPSQQNKHPSVCESTEDSGYQTRSYRSHASASPAPSLPRSNTSSPALGAKPSMFRVKDNTMRGSPFTKSVKPRFHKNFGEDFRVGSPMERVSEQGEEEQEIMRHSAGVPVHPDTGLKKHGVFKQPSSQDYSAHLPQHRPHSRRSIVLDEDDSRSVMSNMSEDVESFATSAADLADIRGLYDLDRPESACSYSSDVSRSMGKPPVVPPKSEKALRRAKRLTTRRIKKESCKAGEDSPAGVEKPLQEVPPPSSSTELQ
ncbi:cardiac-enriched FHL2-interacting protein isoform X2 [Paralichthys olivaceus]|uniref:cardiac-enriched FHL2-interacting protein isoform X2 n=1 Tax=Paralichthys olivaceus TaxID=8255 RepID=UPI003751F6B3